MTNTKQTQDDRTIQPFNCSTIQRVKAYAFTLAETLIVIGIIGVVAALTLPNLNHATGDKEKVTKVKKIYASLTDAVDRAQAVYGDADTWFNDLAADDYVKRSERFAKRVTEFMKVSKDCGFGDEFSEGCFSRAPLLEINGERLNYYYDYYDSLIGKFYMVTLQDGMSLRFGYLGYSYKIGVDIDGTNNGKNQEGNDLFDFSVYVDKEEASRRGANINQLYPSAEPNLLTGKYNVLIGNYTTAWVIQNDNLDYLKCPDELNWETKTSCQ